jgi:hypothetical protein
MSVLERIAYYRNRRDEVPNQELARDLAQRADTAGIREIAEGLSNKNHNVRSDCLKVLYEIGYEKPDLIAPYAEEFLALLEDKNNRMVWGAMIALGTIAGVRPEPLRAGMKRIVAAIDKGTLITMVWGIRALSRAAAGSGKHAKAILPRLKGWLVTCLPRDVPTHLESMLPLLDASRWRSLRVVVESRMKEMTPSHLARLRKVVRAIEAGTGG